MKGSRTLYATNACPSGKRAFLVRQNAKAAAKSAQRAGLGKMFPYFCQSCERWHIGHRYRIPLDQDWGGPDCE